MAAEDRALTLSEYLEEERALELEAAEELPGRIDCCTRIAFASPVRQRAYVCLDCAPGRSDGGDAAPGRMLCYGCSVSCHTDCRVADLGMRREWQCCCGDSCTLYKKPADAVCDAILKTQVGLDGRFCVCRQEILCDESEDPPRTMLQCVLCEDWFHTDCIGLSQKERLESGVETNTLNNCNNGGLDEQTALSLHTAVDQLASDSTVAMPADGNDTENLSTNTDAVDADCDVVPAGLAGPDNREGTNIDDIPAEDCELVCAGCIGRHPFVNLLVSKSAEKVCISSIVCVSNSAATLLPPGWRARICGCAACSQYLADHQLAFLCLASDDDLPTARAEADADARAPLHDLAVRAAAETLPAEALVRGVAAVGALKRALLAHLEPIAAAGRVITAEDVAAAFDLAKRPRL